MLFDHLGHRKYATTSEWQAFLTAATGSPDPLVRSFCWTLASTGARISEVLSLTPDNVDVANNAIIIECLKRRKRGIYRAVPISPETLAVLEEVHHISAQRADPHSRMRRLWPWCRTTAWKYVKQVCARAGVPEEVAMPKAFRHSFGVRGAVEAGVPLTTMKKWLGHAKLETTAIYTEAVGDEERMLAKRMWASAEKG